MRYNDLTNELQAFYAQNGLVEKDFYCHKCGKFMLAIDELYGIVPNIKGTRVYLTHNGHPSKPYTESEQNRWLVAGKYIKDLDKRFFRTICWDCFFENLHTVFDVNRKARKGKWAAKVQKERIVPYSWVATAPWFKLVFDMTDEEYLATKKKLATASKNHFIERYGEKEGLKKFKEYSARQSYTCSKEYMMKEKGMTEEGWHDYNQSRASTKENYIRRYGKEDGIRRWQEYCAYEAYAGNTMTWFINKLGEEEGKKKFEEVFQKKAIMKGYSDMSQELFKDVDIALGDIAIDSRWETKNHEFEAFANIDGIKTLYKVDYFLNDKVIEFNGDFWHANPKFYKADDTLKMFDNTIIQAKEIWDRDKCRLQALEKLGYKILVVWENDYVNDKDQVLKDCIDFLKS